MGTISNTTVLSNFSAVERIDLLRDLFGSLYLAVQVHEEILAGLDEGYAFLTAAEAARAEGWLKLVSVQEGAELQFFSSLPTRLHAGEAASLAIAKERGWLFLTDDRTARHAANVLQVPVTGSLGCLVRLVDLQLLSFADANALLRTMTQLGYHSPVSDLRDLVQDE